MYQTYRAKIDDNYAGNSYSVASLKAWYDKNKGTDILALITQVLFPVLVMVYVLLFFIYVLELKPHKLGEKMEKELTSIVQSIKASADAKLWIKIAMSCLFHLLTLIADIVALSEYQRLPPDIQDYYSYAPKCFWSVPIVMIIFDGISFVLIFTAVPILAGKTRKWYRLNYCLLSPFICVASHSYHIIFAFINDPYHATSILLLYGIVAFVHILGFQKVFYCIHWFWEKHLDNDKLRNRCCRNFVVCIVFVVVFVLMGFSIGSSLALLILLPISNAIDDAPNRLYVIYQSSVTFFAAIIAFQILFRQKSSPFSILLTSKRICREAELTTLIQNANWTEKSEKEKELYLIEKVIKAIENLASQTPQANAPTPQANAPTPQANAPIPQANASIPQANATIPQANAPITQANAPIPQANATTCIPQANAPIAIPQANAPQRISKYGAMGTTQRPASAPERM